MSLGWKGKFESSSAPSEKPEPPPAYSRQRPSKKDDQTLQPVRPLNLSVTAGSETATTATKDECIAHLKLLAAFADLRDTIGKSDELFGISNRVIEMYSKKDKMNEVAAVLSEKRWAVYVTRAVERFTVWWQKCVPKCGVDGLDSTLTVKDVEQGKILEEGPDCRVKIEWTPATMPPLDVLMVWHAYMLNPRSFLEDCIRNSKMSFWATGIPWQAMDACIDPSTFDYVPGNDAKLYFKNLTGLEWDNLDDLPMKIVSCPRCQRETQVPWTEGSFEDLPSNPFEYSTGFADKNFSAPCPSCGFTITHESLRVKKFRKDVQNLLKSDYPMPGTVLSLRGAAENATVGRHPVFFPNRLIKVGLRQNLLEISDPRRSPVPTVETIREEFEKALKNKSLLRQTNDTFIKSSLYFGERVSIRRMMSRYWENSSPFALDLVGAVIRQGSFVVKMDDIDWLHSPSLDSTMARLLKKYSVFWNIMVQNPQRIAVPTLDVDLAWHTHQLTPKRYYKYSTSNTDGKFIDHDDKIDEVKLSDAFEWTSKTYQKLTDGQLYSECTCWYCEAVRESHNSGLFSSSSTARARSNAERLHDERGQSSSTMDATAHISAHNAVRAEGRTTALSSDIKNARLRSNYERAVRRHQKRKVGVMKSNHKRNGSSSKGSDDDEKKENDRSRDAYIYAWGYPCPVVPYYGPYMGDPTVHGDMYACNPSCMNVGVGMAGNCVAGACGGGVAAGGCAGGGAGSCAGGGGGCGGGGCAGGGGGCGGGGGGGGCGGGGGGGGCGGGGGGC
ncbi:hypothetical protein FQN54_004958 [Arachnomyces sp. PD_36]|nr:hypothetical protein FQN54_004958 [Arachnomyces sp. PD_36]